MSKGLLAAGLLFSLLAPPVRGQALVVSSHAECPHCRGSFSPVATLVPPDSLPSFVSPQLLRDSKGRFLVADVMSSLPILLFDSAGRFIRTIGSRVPGPGDVSMVRSMASGPGDTLFAFGNLYSVFASDGKLVRSRTVLSGSSANAAIAVPNAGVVVAAPRLTRASTSRPTIFHLVAGDSVVASFGAAGSGAAPWSTQKVLASGGSRQFWSGGVNEYVVEHWSTSGARDRVLARKAEWFPTWTHWDGNLLNGPPPPRLHSIRQDRQGRLWTLSLVASATAREQRRSTGEGPVPTWRDAHRLLDTVIEVIEPLSGRLVASWRARGAFDQLIGDDLVTRIDLDGDGAVLVRICRISFNPPLPR